MAPSAMATQSHASKIKRPVPPGIQTNGINSSTSSPSPSMSAGRLPSGSKIPSNSVTANGLGSNGTIIRPASRIRREAPAHLLGRGQRNSSVGLRSASVVGEVVARVAEPPPYVKDSKYILQKYSGCPPSLVLHMHQAHFRFDQQESTFSYSSPMRILLEHLRSRTIPHELLEYMTEVPFYEGCLIVQVYDHRTPSPIPGANRKVTGSVKAIPFSVHNHNPYLTPSPYVSHPTETTSFGDDGKSKTFEQKDKENMPAPLLPNQSQQKQIEGSPKKPKVMTVVLHPTPVTTHVDFTNKALEIQNLDGRKDSRQDANSGPLSATVPPTPTTGVPPTPQTSIAPPAKRVKKTKIELNSNHVYETESQITLATTAPLFLEPVSSAGEAAALLESLAHPMHSEKPPSPKTRKRTVAEMAADEALAADEERFMLALDERLSSNTASAQGGANPTGGGQAGGASFEPRFEKFKLLENIKNQHEENKKLEKQRRDEAERKSRQDAERNKLEAEKREQDAKRTAMQNLRQQQQAAQEAARRQQALQAQQSQQAMQQGASTPVQVQHAHPQMNMIGTNAMSSQPQRFHQQQVSQAQASSPIIRNPTPQNHSSPMGNPMGNVPMQPSTSSMGGSPARPGSVVHQNHTQMGAAAGHVMTAQRSQQSHAGTPRMPNSTPRMQSTPLNRQLSQTPHMSQTSPLQGQMAHAPSTPMIMMNGQAVPMTAQLQAQIQAQRQAQQHRMQQMVQERQRLAQSGMAIPGQQMSPQQYAQQQMIRAAQAAAQQQGMTPQQHYQARMAAAAMQSGAIPSTMNQNFIANNPGMNIPQNMQQMQQLQAMQQRQLQQQQQQQFAAQQHNMQQPQQIRTGQQMWNQQINQLASQQYHLQRQKLIETQYPNGLPPELDNQLKGQVKMAAQAHIQRQMLAMQQQQQQQGGMQQNMNAMQGGMQM